MSFRTLDARIHYLGGDAISRINKQKLYSLKQALKNSYQTRYIKTPNFSSWPCLINNNTAGLKADYDKKYISIEFESGLEPGDTFEVLDDSTHWMVYLPVITETAYLRSEILRCRYTLDIEGTKYWIYFQGPTETDLRWNLKNNVNFNDLNLSGTIYIKNDEKTKRFFHRFTKIKVDGHVWEVQVTDSISVPGILELEVQEYYDNSIAELPHIYLDGEHSLNVIQGDTTVKQDSLIGYAINPEAYDPKIQWEIVGNPRVQLDSVYEAGRMCKVKVHAGAVGTFKVKYGIQEIEVHIDWQKPIIQGPQEVYPYDTHTYWINTNCVPSDGKVEFSLNTDLATIIDSWNDRCKVEILSGKKGRFTLYAHVGDMDTELPITIKSL